MFFCFPVEKYSGKVHFLPEIFSPLQLDDIAVVVLAIVFLALPTTRVAAITSAAFKFESDLCGLWGVQVRRGINFTAFPATWTNDGSYIADVDIGFLHLGYPSFCGSKLFLLTLDGYIFSSVVRGE